MSKLNLGVTLGIILCSGAVHGVMTSRWQNDEELTSAVGKLAALPLQLGEWTGQDLSLDAKQLTGISGHVYRRYTNAKDNGKVLVFMVCGRPGPVSIHTPDVCYAANGYKIAGKTKKTVAAGGTDQPEFWCADLQKATTSEDRHLKIYWSWMKDNHWVASTNPRLAFANCSVLYKLYVIMENQSHSPQGDQDNCVQFLQTLIPELAPEESPKS